MSITGRQALLDRITEIARRSAAREGIELWDVELAGSGRNRVLRIYIDKPGGVTHGDCELISGQIGTVLDVEDVIPGESYQLEVSSPGVERKLLRPEHYRRYIGSMVRITLSEPVENRRHWDGELADFEDGRVVLRLAPESTMQFRLEQIQKANLKFKW